MSNINDYLRQNLGKISAKKLSIAPNIAEKKLNAAVQSFGYNGDASRIIALYDNTLFGSGKDGLLFTGEQVIYRASFSEAISLPYRSIVSSEYVETLTGGKNDTLEPSIEIVRTDGIKVIIKSLTDCDYRSLAEILQAVISDFEEYKEEKQLIPIAEMSDTLKVAYVKAIINMAYDNDDTIDDKEYAEIISLMTRLAIGTESRLKLHTYMASTELTPLNQLIEQLDSECPDGHSEPIHISLVKDQINLFLAANRSSVSRIYLLMTSTFSERTSIF